MKKYEIIDKNGAVVGNVKMVEDHKCDPLQAYAASTADSYAGVKAKGYTARPQVDPLEGMEPWQRELIVKAEMNETLYKKMEEHLKPPEPDEGMLERLNLCMGFPTTGPRAKDKDYRPYCGNCKRAPRMMRHAHGFKCWECMHVWDLRLVCKHQRKSIDGSTVECQFHELKQGPEGHRCARCLGMHHFSGRIKHLDTAILCDLDCCSPRGFKANTRNEKTDDRWNINCRLGKWSVSSPELADAMREAKHYYQQYHADGEYDE